MRILLVKTSSLGDVVHCLPAASDIARALPDAVLDWTVEEGFAALPALHPAVRTVLPCALRRWRRTPLAPATRREIAAFQRALREVDYDIVVDAQGLFKSALVARGARGERHGLDWRSSREPLRWFYDRVHAIPRALHAVERNRLLCGAALGYAVEGSPDYGVRAAPLRSDWLPHGDYLVLLHGTSHPSKLWPEAAWTALGRRYASAGVRAVVVWGSDAERERAQRLAGEIPGATFAPRLDVATVARLLAGARAAVGVDTGLTHLAAALGVPTVGVYGATDPQRTGVLAPGVGLNLGGIGRLPGVDEVVAALTRLGVAP